MLRCFGVDPKFKGLKITKGLWRRPRPLWYKVNMDGVSRGQPSLTTCGDVFSIYRGFVTGSYVVPPRVQTVLYAEIISFLYVVEIAIIKGWFPCGWKLIL